MPQRLRFPFSSDPLSPYFRVVSTRRDMARDKGHWENLLMRFDPRMVLGELSRSINAYDLFRYLRTPL